MMRIFSVAVVASALLQGCMFAPGQYMDTEAMTKEGGAESSRVELIPITPKLLAMDAATQVSYALPKELLDNKPGPYLFGPNDALYITVWDHPELTVPAGAQQQLNAAGRLVQADGTLFYPYIGTLDAAGLTDRDGRGDAIARELWRWSVVCSGGTAEARLAQAAPWHEAALELLPSLHLLPYGQLRDAEVSQIEGHLCADSNCWPQRCELLAHDYDWVLFDLPQRLPGHRSAVSEANRADVLIDLATPDPGCHVLLQQSRTGRRSGVWIRCLRGCTAGCTDGRLY